MSLSPASPGALRPGHPRVPAPPPLCEARDTVIRGQRRYDRDTGTRETRTTRLTFSVTKDPEQAKEKKIFFVKGFENECFFYLELIN